MKVYLNTKTLTINNQNLLKQDLTVPVDFDSTLVSDILVTVKKSAKVTQKTLLFIISSFSQDFEGYLKSLIKSLESEDAWIMLFCILNSMESGTDKALQLFEIVCQETNVMIFPVFDYFEVKDWLQNFVKSHSSNVFDSLRDIRNEMLLNSIVDCRKGFSNNLNSNKVVNAAFIEDFLENPGLCVETYFPKNAENRHLKEDFTFLLKKKFQIE